MDVKKNKPNTLWEKIILNSCYSVPPPNNSFEFFDPEKEEKIREFARAIRINFQRQEKLKTILDEE